ncbi:MAG TPA: acetamidase/formamidase family protein [Chloroflexia bacterium]|nr:acetamidase/formamidase family protein [Chloroflexia bacterium]
MTTHQIEPERRTLHGTFSPDQAPVLTIDPGDTVVYRTLDAGWGTQAPDDEASRWRFGPRDPEADAGHALCGPIALRGAGPGAVLAVRVNALRPGPYGWTWAGGAPAWAGERLGISRETTLRWTLDADAMQGRDQFGHVIPLRPFMGVMGVAPAEPGRHATAPPRATGGNIDCKELVAGSTLYLPVAVPGALFSVGDGHAAQGDGEVSKTAVECPMEHVSLTFDLAPGPPLRAPRAHTPAGWITFGFHTDLNEATLLALDDMLDLLGTRYGVERPEALALASVLVDLRVTQIANGVHGVHAILPHGALRR